MKNCDKKERGVVGAGLILGIAFCIGIFTSAYFLIEKGDAYTSAKSIALNRFHQMDEINI